MKYIILVPDGVADEPVDALGGKTPLEAANTPNMDWIAQKGLSGLVKIIPDGFAPGSDVGNLSVLGYNPANNFSGRAPLEAANMGIELEEDEVAFRCNVVTTKDGLMEDYSAGHITSEEAAQIIHTINQELGGASLKFYPGKSYRHLMVLKVEDPDLFQYIKCTPPHDILGQTIVDHLPTGEGSNYLVNIMNRSIPILANHPVNVQRLKDGNRPVTMLWFWGQGKRPSLETYQEKFGLTGSMISAVDLVNGIGRLAGLEVITVPGITGYYDTNYKGKAEYGIKSLESHDFVYIHVEATDEAGHNGDAQAKLECIEKFDELVVGTVLAAFKDREDVRILVTPDHPTPVNIRTHTRSPVPFAIYGKGILSNGGQAYNEPAAQKIGVYFESGEQMIKFFIGER